MLAFCCLVRCATGVRQPLEKWKLFSKQTEELKLCQAKCETVRQAQSSEEELVEELGKLSFLEAGSF